MSEATDLPPAKTRAPALNGCGRLEVEVVAGQSTAISVRAVTPLKILVPRARGESVWAYLSSFGGGLVAGDQTSVDLRLGENARCLLSTQASTKVYRNPGSRPCGHRLKAHLGRGSLLALLPDPIQAFAGSSYRQQQEFQLEPGSGLVLVDWLCSGRTARGERWAFNRFQSRNDVFLGGKRILVDSLLLDPADGAVGGSHRLGRFNSLALVLVIGEALAAASAKLLQTVAAQPVTRGAALVCSASAVSGGALLRCAAENVEAAGREIHRHLAFLPEFLQDDPWSRKW